MTTKIPANKMSPAKTLLVTRLPANVFGAPHRAPIYRLGSVGASVVVYMDDGLHETAQGMFKTRREAMAFIKTKQKEVRK